MVFQRLALFPHMTVEQNIAFPLRMRRFQPAEIPARVDHYLTLVRLKGYQKRRISELSGGQQQRVAIARALVFEPALLLLDEPLAALDKKLREEMQLEFRRIQRELGVTTINVTHDQREALVMSDRVLILSDGRMQQFASPTEIYETPSNRFVADFIGMTNFLSGTVSEKDGALGISVHGQFFDAAIPEGPSFAPGRTIECGIRAQHILLGRSAAQANTQFAACVEEAIFEGERVLYQLVVPALNGAKLTAISHREEDGTVLPVGSEVLTGWKKAHILVFPS
jgi:putative spermidine/putrescine transport system ATP-binding protein